MQNIQNLLTTAVDFFGGQDRALEACERMYSGIWRSELVMTVAECEAGEIWELENQLKQQLYITSTGKKLPAKYCERWYDEFSDWCHDNQPAVVLPSDTLVVFLCNYKGEGDGIALLNMVKHLPVFKDKSQSFNDVN